MVELAVQTSLMLSRYKDNLCPFAGIEAMLAIIDTAR